MAAEDSGGLLRWESLARRAQVIRYDARGHGDSQASAALGDYHWRSLGQDMLGLATALGHEQFIAGGQSMGCATTLYAALAAPERVRALVLVNPPTAWEARRARAAVLGQMADLVEAKGMAAWLALNEQLPPQPAWLYQAQPQRRAAYLERMAQADPQALARVWRGAVACDLPRREELAAIEAPALILAWADDPSHPVSTAEELYQRLPRARLVIARDSAAVETWPQQIEEFVLRQYA
jgi:pimeloyl-ACP methyl ester carboxylesterase